MEIVIESMTGHLTHVNVNPLETVKGLKTRIWKSEGIPLSQQSLVYKNQELDDSRQLQDYNIASGATLKLILITRSGPINVQRQNDGDVTVSSLVEYLQNASLPGISTDSANRVGLMIVRDGQHINWYHLVDPNQHPCEIAPNSSNLTQQPSSCSPNCEANKLELRRASAAKRAEENYRTMQRMRELRHSMERLNLERTRRRQANGVDDVSHDDNVNARQRRSSGSSSATVGRMKSSRTFPISNAFLTANAANGPHFLSAAEDTSAKESSAGETEFEDCHPVYNLPPLHNSADGDEVSLTTNNVGVKSNKSHKNHHHHISFFGNDGFPSSVNGSVPPPPYCISTKGACSRRDYFKGTKQFQLLSSSCSDLEPDSSVLVSSDYDAVPTSDQDQELYTADDCWSYDENDQGEIGLDDEVSRGLYEESDYHDTVSEMVDGTGERNAMIVNTKNGTENTASDPSELSSGAIICDLATSSRRSKVRRKYFGQRQLTKRPPQLLTSHVFRWPIDESEEQSSAFEVQSLRLTNTVHEFAARPRAAHQVRFAPRRARSKPRMAANKAMSTGESSSDEKDFTCDGNPTGSTSSQAQIDVRSRPTTTSAAPWKQKQQPNRSVQTSKKFTSEKGRTTVNHINFSTMGASFYPTVATPPTTSSSSVPSVVRNHKLPQSSHCQQRCSICGYKLNLSTTFQCRCGKTVCFRHRSSDLHSCSYDLRRDTLGGSGIADGKKQTNDQQLPKL